MMIPRLLLVLTFPASLMVATPAGAAEDPLPDRKPVPAMQAVPLPGNQVSFRYQERELTRLYWHADQRRPFFYPLNDPAGRSVTRLGDARDPVGHSHHNSLWMAHQDVDGINFWEDPVRKGNGFQRVVQVDSWQESDTAAGCVLRVEWVADEGLRLMLQERRTVQVLAPEPDGSWLMVIDSEFTPPGPAPVTFRQSYFGLLGVRVVTSASVKPGGGRLLNSNGGRNEAGTFRLPARWVDLSGALTNSANGGVALFDHPDNPGHPNPVHTRDGGFADLTFSGHESRTVAPGQPLLCRYGIWTHPGVPDQATVEAAWQRFAALPQLPVKQAR
jgi:hypothetical protein